MATEAEIVIIGSGVMGLAIAYNLALRGQRGIVVLDAHYLAWGASGRNGGGLRQQWSTEMNIRLMQESMEICAGFAQEMGINVWMRQGGYLFLAQTEAMAAALEKNIALQHRCDVPTQQITLDEVRAIVPELETDGFAAASYNPTDGIVFPWPFLWGYANAAAKRGVSIRTASPVTAIARRGDDFVVTTPKGVITCGRVVNAAGAWSPQVAALVGVTLPNRPARHEIMSTEPLKPFLRPMVSVLESGLYFSQSLRGEVVGGISLDDPPQTEILLGSRLRFLQQMAQGLCRVMPRLGDVKVVRQWAGPYDLSPDANPIVGQAPGVPGFYVCCGFRGHGFMMAPVIGKYYALHLLGQTSHPLFKAWRPDRFAGAGGSSGGDGGPAQREEMFIG